MRNDDPRLMHHHVQGKRDWKSRAVPITLHGDGVRFSMAGNTLLTYQWAVANVLANLGASRRFPISRVGLKFVGHTNKSMLSAMIRGISCGITLY